ALCKDDLVAERAYAHRFDVDPELRRPEAGQGQVRPAVALDAYHVVSGNLGPKYCVIPMFERNKLVVVQHVRKARYVTSNKDTIGDYSVNVEGAAARIAAHTPKASRQPGPFQPFGVTDRT